MVIDFDGMSTNNCPNSKRFRKTNTNQENRSEFVRNQETFTAFWFDQCKGYLSILHSWQAHGSQSIHDCTPNRVENLCHGLFASVAAYKRISNQVFITLKFGCKQLDMPLLCRKSNIFDSLPIGNFFICLSTYSTFISPFYSLCCETHSRSKCVHNCFSFFFWHSAGCSFECGM